MISATINNVPLVLRDCSLVTHDKVRKMILLLLLVFSPLRVRPNCSVAADKNPEVDFSRPFVNDISQGFLCFWPNGGSTPVRRVEGKRHLRHKVFGTSTSELVI